MVVSKKHTQKLDEERKILVWIKEKYKNLNTELISKNSWKWNQENNQIINNRNTSKIFLKIYEMKKIMTKNKVKNKWLISKNGLDFEK